LVNSEFAGFKRGELLRVPPDQDRRVFPRDVVNGDSSDVELVWDDEAGVGDGMHAAFCGKLM
jgi:hypothetical protein